MINGPAPELVQREGPELLLDAPPPDLHIQSNFRSYQLGPSLPPQVSRVPPSPLTFLWSGPQSFLGSALPQPVSCSSLIPPTDMVAIVAESDLLRLPRQCPRDAFLGTCHPSYTVLNILNHLKKMQCMTCLCLYFNEHLPIEGLFKSTKPRLQSIWVQTLVPPL